MKEEKKLCLHSLLICLVVIQVLDYNVVVKLNRLAAIPPTWNNLVVHFTVTESDIPFSWQGKQKLTTLKDLWCRMN